MTQLSGLFTASSLERSHPHRESEREYFTRLARERKMAPDRKIGSMDKDTVMKLLYPDGADTVIPGAKAATKAKAEDDDEPATPRRGRRAAAAADIDEEVSAAARKASSNGHTTGAGDALIELIAQAVAARVKELVDA